MLTINELIFSVHDALNDSFIFQQRTTQTVVSNVFGEHVHP